MTFIEFAYINVRNAFRYFRNIETFKYSLSHYMKRILITICCDPTTKAIRIIATGRAKFKPISR